MKLKVLPPTLRKNNRYLTVNIKSEALLNKKDLVGILWDASIRFWGECETANFNLWVMRFYELEQSEGIYNYKSIIRCQRGFEDKVRVALVCVKKFNNKRISFSTIGLSGTIKSSTEKYINF